jgi:alkylated DNA nucleotide flippase Atl1
MSKREFSKEVYAVTREIPYGKVTSWHIAKALGTAVQQEWLVGQ